ncbi:MAG: hypothetical protein KA099_09015 [Alphaproteobacteria bacterium]|nr:hypothetical protein [Alphaproteobacteria bacterium]MBP7759173.1 hypothetical protein [Alphaproteobacteria bacterium]MBP7762629.1 hypothetical protein [Alphaproteobacteria bacterium]MBP7905451.1 hypothetical protein [Alphaproteobacteria bacterium]
MKKGILAAIGSIFIAQPAQAQNLTHAEFWDWFIQNKSMIEQYDKKTEAVMNAVQGKIKAVYPDLWFEIGQAEDKVYEFIISAGGLKSAIPSVIDLYKAAPQIPGWRVIAFKPRHATPILDHGGIRFNVADFYYQSEYYEGMTDLKVCVKGLTKENEDVYGMAGFLLLDTVIGEYDVMTTLGNIKFEPLPQDRTGLKPLSALAAEIDAHKPAPN